MAFNRKTAGNGPLNPGMGGEAIDLSTTDFTVLDTVKAIVVTSAGNVVLRSVLGVADITPTAWPAGAVLPWHCAAIRKIGTTAGLATVTEG